MDVEKPFLSGPEVAFPGSILLEVVDACANSLHPCLPRTLLTKSFMKVGYTNFV